MKSYNDYTPQIAELDAAWNAVAENLETLVDSVETKEAIAAATYIFVGNHLFKLKITVPQLAQSLSNRYDYQFDLMDSLTATTTMQAANGLTQGFEDLERQLSRVRRGPTRARPNGFIHTCNISVSSSSHSIPALQLCDLYQCRGRVLPMHQCS